MELMESTIDGALLNPQGISYSPQCPPSRLQEVLDKGFAANSPPEKIREKDITEEPLCDWKCHSGYAVHDVEIECVKSQEWVGGG